jgi:hemolysin III
VHQVAFFVSIPAGVVLVVIARGTQATVAALIFSLSLAGVFGVSASYHRGSWSGPALRRMKRLDHSMIFVLIAGSYTPFCLLVLDRSWGIPLLVIVWTGAFAGVLVKQLGDVDRLHWLSGFLYITLGWVVVIAMPQMVRDLSSSATTLLVAGGLLYTLGAIVLATKRPDPDPAVFGYHEIWHAMGTGAGLCHYLAITLVVLAAR